MCDGLLSLSLPWTSDVTAPAAPTISKITSVAPAGGRVGYRLDLEEIPAGARHVIVKGKLNGGAYLPFSTRARFEEGYDYMKFRGDVDVTEEAGERNELHLSFAKGLAVGDVVQPAAAAEDASGNRSDFQAGAAFTLEGQTYISIPQTDFEIELDDEELEVICE